MKKYPTFDEWKHKQDVRRMHEELKAFQSLLREAQEMDARYHGKSEAIANGLQPWIDALELYLSV